MRRPFLLPERDTLALLCAEAVVLRAPVMVRGAGDRSEDWVPQASIHGGSRSVFFSSPPPSLTGEA
jgi:hypothetical protein